MSALLLPEHVPFSVPDYVEPVEAWRVWRISGRGDDLVLESLFADAIWEPGVPLTATCATGSRCRWRPWRVRFNEHAAPELDCTCGIYGVATPEAAGRYLDARVFVARVNRVIGRVALWGDVVESTAGWRASHAYPIELFVPVYGAESGGLRRRADLDEIATGLGAYRVPVDFVGDPRPLAGVFG